MTQPTIALPDNHNAIQSLKINAVYTALQSRPAGLTSAEAAERLQQYGPNVIQEIKGKPLGLRLLANFTHLMAILLWVGGIVAFIAQMPQIGVAIWMVNIINGVFSFWQEFKAEKATEALRKTAAAYVRALRDGEEQRILAEELVPGDVLLVGEGDRISADARLVQEAELRAGPIHPERRIAPGTEDQRGRAAQRPGRAPKSPTWSLPAPTWPRELARPWSLPPAWTPSSARSPI